MTATFETKGGNIVHYESVEFYILKFLSWMHNNLHVQMSLTFLCDRFKVRTGNRYCITALLTHAFTKEHGMLISVIEVS